MKLAVIGGGSMGGAIAARAVDAGVVSSADLLVIDPSEERRNQLSSELGCSVAESVSEQLQSFDTVLIAVKPQSLNDLFGQLGNFVSDSTLLVSIVGGARLDAFSDQFGEQQQIVRSMPNLPARYGRGVMVYIGSENLTESNEDKGRELLGACGVLVKVDEESLIDCATAISGSGPGYVYYFAEKLIGAAEELGFSSEQATLLVQETMAGALKHWGESGESPEQLRAQVTSKGGTTQAAIESFEADQLGEGLAAGVRAARDRAKELGA